MSVTPAVDRLFRVRGEYKAGFKEEYRAEMFHHSVSLLLFMISQSSRDIHIELSFITTILKRMYEDDWGKLKRVLKYLKGTKHMKLILRLDSLSVVNWWVYASYNTHDDFRIRTGFIIILVKGGVFSLSLKHNISVKISTEA